MKVKTDTIKMVGVRPIFLARVDVLVRRVQRGQGLGSVTITADGELIEGEHELHAARRLGLAEVDVIVKERP